VRVGKTDTALQLKEGGRDGGRALEEGVVHPPEEHEDGSVQLVVVGQGGREGVRPYLGRRSRTSHQRA